MKIFAIRFEADSFEPNGSGFEFVYEAIDREAPLWTYRMGECGDNFTTVNGLFTSPSYPEEYPINTDCTYIISQPNDIYVNISVLEIDIEHSTYCNWDYLEIRNGISEESPLLVKLCGKNIPASIQSTQKHVWMR